MDNEHILSYDGLVLDLLAHSCRLDGETIPLTPTQYEIVKVLLQSKGELVTSGDLFRQVWNTKRYCISEKSNLTAHIKCLRKRLGDDAAHPRFISTVHGRGYRLGTDPAPITHTEETL